VIEKNQKDAPRENYAECYYYSVILKQLLDILVCPAPDCRKPLTLAADESSMQCTGCKRIYPVRDGIPILLVDQASMPK
jgi:uncharacterized protein YbaR (Trm112 family)